MTDIPNGFKPANFSIDFLVQSGPYYLRMGETGTVVAQRITESHMNNVGVAHGGVLATLADVAMSFQIFDSKRPRPAMVTNSLTTNFLSGAKLGDWIEAYAKIDRVGKRTAYTSAEIRRGDDILVTTTGVFTILRTD